MYNTEKLKIRRLVQEFLNYLSRKYCYFIGRWLFSITTQFLSLIDQMRMKKLWPDMVRYLGPASVVHVPYLIFFNTWLYHRSRMFNKLIRRPLQLRTFFSPVFQNYIKTKNSLKGNSHWNGLFFILILHFHASRDVENVSVAMFIKSFRHPTEAWYFVTD